MKSSKKRNHRKIAKFKTVHVYLLVVLLVFASIGAYLQTRTKAAESLFAGHVPGRVLLGMAATEQAGKFPQYAEALGITGPVYERRIFKPGWITASSMNSMLNECDAEGQYCVISFKVPNNNWRGVANGQYDSDLDVAMSVARSRAKPFAFGIHHEPIGNGDAADWVAMQEHAVEYLSPVNSKMAYTTIANGHIWGPNQDKPDLVLAYYPQSLLNKMNQFKGIVAADFYDAEPDESGVYKRNADRTSMKLQAFVDWARSKGVKAVGAGEFGTTTADELTKSWKVMYNNRDIFGYANYFNSPANSRYDWRLIPDSYPIKMPDDPNDQGGTPESEARLKAFQAAVIESASGGSGGTNAVPSVPGNVKATSADAAVTVTWSASTDSDGTVSGYELRHKTTSSTTWGAPVALTGTSRTVNGLTNGTSYDFQVRAKDNTGAYSAYSTAVAATPAVQTVAQSDLVVTAVSLTPTAPNVGQTVMFSATVKNQGGAATPSGTIHNVLFQVDGVKVAWSNTHLSSLAPGASVTLTANSGPTGSAGWLATAGAHTVQAWTDDVNRIVEVSDDNNTFNKPFTVGTATKAGDLNNDGQVNILDLSKLLTKFNQTGGAADGDLTGDGQINISDLSVLMTKWGS